MLHWLFPRKNKSVAENCTWPVKPALTPLSSYRTLILQGLLKDSAGTFEGVTLQWLWEGLSLLKTCRILLNLGDFTLNVSRTSGRKMKNLVEIV